MEERYEFAIAVYLKCLELSQIAISSIQNSKFDGNTHNPDYKIIDAVNLLMVTFLSLSYCFEMIFDLPRMILTLKTASMIRNKAYKPTHELGRYINKMIKLTNRKYARGYNSLKEMKQIIMYTFKKFCKYDYHRDFSFEKVDENYFETNALENFAVKMQRKSFKIKKKKKKSKELEEEKKEESGNSEDMKLHFDVLNSSKRKEKEEREKEFHFRNRWEHVQHQIRKFIIVRNNTKKKFGYKVDDILDKLNVEKSSSEEEGLRFYNKKEYEVRGYIKGEESNQIKKRKKFNIPVKNYQRKNSKKFSSAPTTKRSFRKNSKSENFTSRTLRKGSSGILTPRVNKRKKVKSQMIKSTIEDPVKLLEFKPKEKPKDKFDYQIKYESVFDKDERRGSFSLKTLDPGLKKPDLVIGIDNITEALTFDNLFSKKVAENLEGLGKKFKTKLKSKNEEKFIQKILNEDKKAVQFYKKYFNIKKKRGVKYERVGAIGGVNKMGGRFEGEEEKLADLKRGDGRMEDYDLDEKFFMPQREKFKYYENKVDMLNYKKYLEAKKKKITFHDLNLKKLDKEYIKPSWLNIILKHKDVFKLRNFRMIRKMRLKQEKIIEEQEKLSGRSKKNSGLTIAEMRKSIRLDKYNRRVSLINYQPRSRRSIYEDFAQMEKMKKEAYNFSKKLLDKEINKMEDLLHVKDGGLSELENIFKKKKTEELDAFHKKFLQSLGKSDLAESLKGKFKRGINLLEVMRRARKEYQKKQKEERLLRKETKKLN